MSSIATSAVGPRRAPRDDAYARDLRGAVRTLSRSVLGSIASVSISEPINPDLLVQAYIVSGGDWQGLAAAVNRHGLDAQGRRPS